MKYKIEKNVPINKTNGAGRIGKWPTIVAQMESGDSILVKNRVEAYALRKSLLAKGWPKVVTRKEGTGIRVWGFKTLKHHKEAMARKGNTLVDNWLNHKITGGK